MSETPNIFEKAFTKTDKTDAILVVQGKKMHVNKALLSYHSDYFNTLFNSDFKEKSMKEISIDDVIFEDFATLLSLIHEKPIMPTAKNAEKLLELAIRFQLESAKIYLELFLMSTKIDRLDKIRIADKYRLENLLDHALAQFTKENDVEFSGTKSETPNIYEKTFAKTDKTDAILVVDEKKLHVNAAILSYHSDYFNTLFNSDFKEKSMEEIPIDDVIFEDFATLLSLVHEKPIKPTESNAEKLLELSDRFLMPSVKQHLEFFLLNTDINRLVKIRIGDKYQLDDLIQQGISEYKSDHKFIGTEKSDEYKVLSDTTKVRYLTHLVKMKY